MDGHLRVYDLVKNKMFRDVSPDIPTRIISLANESMGDFIFCGGFDPYSIFITSIRQGGIIDNLLGHEGPVHLMQYADKLQTLISASWDRTIKLWKPFLKGQNQETINMVDKIIELKVSTDDKKFFVATLRNEIHIYDVEDANVIGLVDIAKYTNSSLATPSKHMVR